MTADKMLRIEPLKTALIIQDMQNDVLSEGGAWADSGRHCMPSPGILWRTWRFLRPKLAAREHPSSMSTTSWNLEQWD